jgi:hypothetical protein
MRRVLCPVTIVAVLALCAGLSACDAGRQANRTEAALAVSPPSLQFSAAIGQQSDPAPKFISVSNSAGAGALTFAASTDADWLAVTPAGGSAPQTLEVSAMIGALAPGTYTGHVIVASTGVNGSPAIVTVTFTLLRRANQ